MQDLFGNTNEFKPLAERLRPNSLTEFIGQTHLLSEGKALRKAIEGKKLHSMIFWGPPGVGKTTLAKIIAQSIDAAFIELSAVQAGVKDIKAAAEQAKAAQFQGKQTILFVDEVHRFNKAQQDAFLPHVENGTFIFVGATTENPSFELNSALLSRARVYLLKAFQREDFLSLWERARATDAAVANLQPGEEAMEAIINYADGDARRFLNLLEILIDNVDPSAEISNELLTELLQAQPRRFDKSGEYFYDQISAFHKSVRGSSPDAALYWLCRMLDGGADPIYLARRIVRIASEDIGNADPRALQLALNAWETQERLGSPEGELSLAQATLYLAAAPKSNATYTAYNRMMKYIKTHPTDEVPLHLRNAATSLLKDLDYGAGYRYAHDEPDAYAIGVRYTPEDFPENRFYEPVARGMEIKIGEKLRYLRELEKKVAEGKKE